MNRGPFILIWLLACAGVWVAGEGYSRAQETLQTRVRGGFSHAEPFDPPNETQTRYLLKGSEAYPTEQGGWRILKPTLEVFRLDGQREFLVNAPECIYDLDDGSVKSDGAIEVTFLDGRFSIAGVGFGIDGKRMLLAISNDVVASVREGLAEARTEELEIRSDRFDFDATNRHGVFRGNVRGEDAEMSFSCGILSALATSEAGSFDLIEADQDVVIRDKQGQRSASAQHAKYTGADEVVEMTGGVTWKQEQHQGRSNQLRLHRGDQAVEATGEVAMKLPRDSFNLEGFFLTATNQIQVEKRDKTGLVDLLCDHFQSHSNLTEARGNVRIVDGTNRLACESLRSRVGAGDSPSSVVEAEGGVVVEQGDNSIRSERASFTESNSIVLFTGQPRWVLSQTRGEARRVTLNAERGDVLADGDVKVELPFAGGGRSFLKIFAADEETNVTQRLVRVYAREFMGNQEQVTFLGGVRAHEAPITGSEPRLRSQELQVRFGKADQAEYIQARKNVIFEQGLPGTTNGPATYGKLESESVIAHADESGRLASVVARGEVRIEQPGSSALGESAEYDALRDRLVMSGQPILTTPQAVIQEAQTLIYDRGKESFTATAPYKIKLTYAGFEQARASFREKE